MRVYIDLRDWWVGLYIGDEHVYVCPLPCLVVRTPREDIRWPKFTEVYEAMSILRALYLGARTSTGSLRRTEH